MKRHHEPIPSPADVAAIRTRAQLVTAALQYCLARGIKAVIGSREPAFTIDGEPALFPSPYGDITDELWRRMQPVRIPKHAA